MSTPEGKFLVARSCTRKIENTGEHESRPLADYRDLPAYVLLGDPGAGKTESFKREAEASGGEYIRARNFATLEPVAAYQGKTLFIDGLDEMRTDGGDGRTPLDHIRKHLERLGRPRFRLSCREADWLGASDSEALKHVSQDGEIIALHLDPLSDADITEILKHKSEGIDHASFMRQAREHGLDELLRNPQTLNLMVDAVGGNPWPKSRTEIYALACDKLVAEKNIEHRQAKREKALPSASLIEAAGYLCATQLLSSIAGYALDDDSADEQHRCWKELLEQQYPLLAALKTNLFQSDGEELRICVHRSVAEFLGARYLAERIELGGLPFGRVLALMTGEDGGVVPDLRGLAAWLVVHCYSGRHSLIERDPVGVVLYGDVRNFSKPDKLHVIEAWKREAQRYPWFASERWTSSSSNAAIGALCIKEMESTLLEMLTATSRDEAEQAMLDAVLDAMCHGEQMPALLDPLEAIVRDTSYWPTVRNSALAAMLHAVAGNYSRPLKLAQDIVAGLVEDDEDELLGILLSKLYPVSITPSEIFSYLHLHNENVYWESGRYSAFWGYVLPKEIERKDLPIMLDKLVQLPTALKNARVNYRRMAGELLARGLECYGDEITDERLYDWLGVGLNEHEEAGLDREYAERISSWFAGRTERHKAVIEHGATRCIEQENVWYCMSQCSNRLYGASRSADIGLWFLEKAAIEPHPDLSNFYFTQAVHMLRQHGGEKELTFPVLDFLETWTRVYPKFEPWLEPFISSRFGEWQQKHAIQNRTRKVEDQKRKKEWVGNYRKHIAAIRNGSAYPQIHYDLARAYEGLLYEVHGETPRQRLEDFLDGDAELVEAAYSGFRHVLVRADLPSVSEIIDLELKGKMHFIRSACLVGMDELFRSDPVTALTLPDEVLSRLFVFRLSYSVGNEPTWVSALVKIHPALAAEAILAYALPMLRAKKEHVSGVYQLVHDDAYAEVARLALPKLLESFPLRANAKQLDFVLDPLLKGALHFLDKKFLLDLVARKLKLGSLDAAQRVYWLSCGLLLAPEVYEAKVFQYIGKSETRRGYLANFIYNHYGGRKLPDWVSIPVSVLSRLIELLGAGCSNQRREGIVTAAMRMADMVRSYISTLGGNPADVATDELERLISLTSLLHWRNELRSALHSQRIARRKASFQRLEVVEVSRTLANLQPANAADLAALTFDHLLDIARKIRDGSTNDYKQYWSYDDSNKKLAKPKPENDCRDALLSDLNERLGKLGINAEREGNYADDKRADIKVLFGGSYGFNVPIEIKKDSHDDLWRAIHEQLIPKYVRDPGADGYGIYLVFWFGGIGMKPPSDGKKLRSASELEARLRQTLTPEESHRIQVCVIDCALP